MIDNHLNDCKNPSPSKVPNDPSEESALIYLLSLPDFALREIIKNANDIVNKSYPDTPRFFFERRQIRNEHIGAEIIVRISREE